MKQQSILKFWRDIEIFNLPDFKNEACLFQKKDLLPWFKENEAPKKNYKRRYTLFFGKIDKKIIVEYLNCLLKSEVPTDWEESVTGFSYLSALILDEKGCLQQDSYVTASYIFGIGSLEQNKHLSSVTDALEKSKEDFYQRYNFMQNDFDQEQLPQVKKLSWEHLNKEIAYLKTLNKWCYQQDIGIYILKECVHKDSEANTSFLNSFYLDDLNYLSAIKENELGAALQSYLTITPAKEKRKDIIQNKKLFFQSFDPRLMTLGRWPSKIAYGLYSAQMGAVHTIFSNLRKNEGLQGINGPPGTGKTTLLLDIIAEIVVERAQIISDLGCDRLFEGYHKIEKESGYELHTYTLKKSLKNNFGVVVASNNNAAVENISKALPLKSKIDIEAFPGADYFSSCCSKSFIDGESWGVLAAALGNSTNKNTFRKAFWESGKDTKQPEDNIERKGFDDFLHTIYKDPKHDETDKYRINFNNQNEIFKSLLKEFDHFKKTASLFHQQLPDYIENKQKEKELIIESAEVESTLFNLSIEKQNILEKESIAKQDADRLQLLMSLHMQRKPLFFFFQKLFSTAVFKQWNSETEELMINLKSVDSRLEAARKELATNTDKIKALHLKQAHNKRDLAKLNVFFSAYKKLQDTLGQTYEIETQNLFNIDFEQKTLAEIHLLNPYHSPKVAKLRSDIFITALSLHHDAILVNAKNIRNNLKAFFEMTAGHVKVDNDVAQNLWDTFFLSVPVVSTTLASASRLFPNINKNQIGWLLIDEAGQATPQSAVGLMHRSKRCVIVGDPLQVEPVVTMPKKMVAKLRREQDVAIDWSPYKVSVQQLADRVSYSGTYMQVGSAEEKIWTGFPLRVHRRCDDPMFTIANKIAYGNQMVKAIGKNRAEAFIGASQWFHVECECVPYQKQVILEEITLLKSKIEELLRTGYAGNIYVISPFKTIADYCADTFKSQKAYISCGTIHTFQGKEADIVLMVLGSDPKSSGARNWASEKPNLLNVALTRAKKRFYVIGNKKLWACHKHFDTMATVLN